MFQKIRTVLFWLHLVLGVLGGVFIFSMSVSGTLVAFELNIINFMESGQQYVKSVPEGAKQLDPETLIAKVQEARPNLIISGLALYADPTMSAKFSTGARGSQSQLYVNPYTAEILGEGDNSTRGMFRWLVSFHRWFALTGSWKEVGETINAVAVLMFLAIIVTGTVIWMPRRWTWRALKPITQFDTKLKGKARDWNWHNVLGIWSLPVILFITLTGTIIAHTWASNLLYTLTGSPLPAPRQGPGGGGGEGPRPAGAAGEGQRTAGGNREGRGEGRGGEARGEGREGRAPRGEGAGAEGRAEGQGQARGGEGREGRAPRGEGAGAEGRTPRAEGGAAASAPAGPAPKINVANQNALWEAAKKQVPDWVFITHQLSANPRGNSAEFTIDRGNGRQPYLSDTLTLNRTTAAVEKWAPFSTRSTGDQLRRWARFGHTGEAFGFFGQVIAFLGALSTAVLVYTGLFLTWRRFFGKHTTTPPTQATTGKAKGKPAPGTTATEPAATPAPAVASEGTPAPAKS